MPDTFESMSLDIGKLIPGLDEAINGEVNADAGDGASTAEQFLDDVVDEIVEGGDDEVADDDEENISEEATQSTQDVDNEGKPNEVNDALGQALARLSALENENLSLRGDLETANVKANAPVFIPFDELSSDLQDAYEARAERMGIDPRHLLYDDFKDIQREHESKARALTSQRDDGAKAAYAHVDKFFDAHPLKAKHGKLIPQLVNEMGWAGLQPLAKQNPEIFKATAVALVDAAFRKAAADEIVQQRTLKQQKTLKESTRSEASRAKPSATLKTTKPDNGEIDASSMSDFIKKNANPLESLFR